MSVFGIVSEFNPFHKGHEYLISAAKEMGAEAVVSVMSSSSTQRGELAAFDKYLRAEAAVSGGADLVLELPFPWCSASAEYFSSAAIKILAPICDTVIFGSESGDIELLRSCADAAFDESFKEEYSCLLSKGAQSASAYTSLIQKNTGAELLSNDILGVEYIKAAKRLGVELDFVTVKRKGSGYLCSEPSKQSFDSALAIRNLIMSQGNKNGNKEELRKRLPKKSFELIEKAMETGEYTNFEKYLDSALFFYRMTSPDMIDEMAECRGGIAQRICAAAQDSVSGKQFFESLKTKRYTDAKLRRALLFGMTGVRDEDLLFLPEYTLLLAADAKGRELISSCRKDENAMPVITKMTDLAKLVSKNSKRQKEMSDSLSSVFTFCLNSRLASGSELKKKPFIT